MIQNRNMTTQSRTRVVQHYVDISETAHRATVLYEPSNDIKILRIDMVYAVATDASAAITEGVTVGTIATPTLYGTATPLVSQAAGVKAAVTLGSTALLPAGTALVLTRTAYSGHANGGEVVVVVHYELVDA
jgi:hypothetical protein